ncbi:MAG TPA: multidrug efflux RND transporter permease subunit [Ramlibacter sp.]
MAKFFIDRPIFAWVIALFIIVLGGVAITQLPIAQYPPVAPPSIVISTNYPGASARTLEESVISVIEQEMNGSPGLIYMESVSQANGSGQITLSVQPGTPPDLAQVDVQNRLSRASPRLPQAVTQQGVRVDKARSNFLLFTILSSDDPAFTPVALGDYASRSVLPEIQRIPGVGQARLFGTEQAMRIWIDPAKLLGFNLSSAEVNAAIRAQNAQVSSGSIGDLPNIAGQGIAATVVVNGQLASVEQFGAIVLRANTDGSTVRIKDVARIELGAQSYAISARLNGRPSTGIGVQLSPTGNALATADAVRKRMQELSAFFPSGVKWTIPYDSSRFVKISITQVVITLLEAVALVFLVMFLFLQNWRYTIIPTLVVPIALLGTFGALLALGFSINVLTMFGMVLVIGIVVDDAIVVVENVQRNIEAGLSPREATYRAMREVSGPIIAIALALVAVFVPMAFISGLSGQFYQQFALTIAISTVISTVNSLTLSPALSALLLKAHGAPKDALTRGMDRTFGWLFRGFNALFGGGAHAYRGGVARVLSRKALMMALYLFLVAATALLFRAVPGGFVPQQDKGYLIGFAQLPDGATLDRTEDVIRRMGDIMIEQPGVENAVAFPGLSINGFTNSSNAGIVFARLGEFEDRRSPALSGGAIAGQLNQKFAAIPDAFIAIFPPPPVQGLGTTGGFKLQLEDRASLGYEALDGATKSFLQKATQTPELAGMFSSYQVNVPQLYADVDRTKARQLGVSVTDVFDAMQIYLGSLYVNDFNRFGRTYSVRVQADAPYRARAEDVGLLKVRSSSGQMVPLSALMSVSPSSGPERAMRYNGFLAADINGRSAPGFSSGQAQDAVERVAAETLPAGIGFEWTELTYQEILAGNSAVWVFPLSVLLVFLVLAALYESLVLPLSIILIVPMGLLAAMSGVWLTGGDNNIFTQIGLMVLVGLSAKNAILIVEFARELEFAGRTPVQAAIEASQLRLRPILMTSIAFIMGVLPLAFSTGAGAEMRQAMGVAVFSGMIGVTAFGIFLTPVFYVLLRAATGNRPLKRHGEVPHDVEAFAGGGALQAGPAAPLRKDMS